MSAFKKISIFAFGLFVFAQYSYAATLFIDPPSGEYGPGDTFVLTVRIDLDGEECVNAVAGELSYSRDWMRAVAISKGESVLTLWPDEPSVDIENGIVRFNGGIPAGYCGRVQGDPGKTNILAKIVFSIPGNMIGGKVAKGPEPLTVEFTPNTQVLLNDGFGTPAPLSTVGGLYTRIMSSHGLANEWTNIVHADVLPPDSFTVSVERDPQTYRGKYFIVFSTVDKQSGVQHYEVIEDDPNRFGFVLGKSEQAVSVTTKSPYVLRDQTLGSRIIVRAYDHAGNVQETMVAPREISVITPPGGEGGRNTWWITVLISLVFIIITSGIWLYVRARTASTSTGEQMEKTN